MTSRSVSRVAVLVAALVAAVVAPACSKNDTGASPGETVAADFPLRVVRDIPLPGGTTRLDYQDIDPQSRRLYIAHLGDGTIHVIDLDQLTVSTTIDDVASVHGVRVAPDLGRLYASATGTNEVVSIDTGSNQVVSRAPTGSYPDGIAYDPKDGKGYISNEHDTGETVFDAHTGERVSTVDVGGEGGNSAYDATTGYVLVNVQDKGHIAVIDPVTDTVIETIDTPGCESNHGLYIDADNRLAFVACEGNAKLLVINLDTKEATATLDIGSNPDVMAFDYGLHRLYIASESGTVAILDENNGTLQKVGQAKVAGTAHTVAVDQETHQVFFPLENVDGHPTLRVMEPTDIAG